MDTNQLGFKIKEKYVSNDIVDFSFKHFPSKNEFVELNLEDINLIMGEYFSKFSSTAFLQTVHIHAVINLENTKIYI